jgi:serine/threonine-protein kinase
MSMPPSVPGVREGDLLAGKYRVDRVLGAGGMGVVVAAHHIHLDEKVAIKFLLPEMLDSGEAVARFAREARAAVKIKSEHVARVTDVGTLENGAPYMVMEYLEGGDLAGWLRQRGPLSVEQASDFVLQACEAIAEAHALGIVHRDLKPANLFVVRRPDGAFSVKVLDFGISKMRSAGGGPDPSITRTSAMMGSPLYMSPEQMHSAKDVDLRTDIWALGIILHELVAGASPFLADTVPELVAKILSAPLPPLRSVCPHAPPGFEAVVAKCLEKDRRQRFESVGDLANALAPYAPRRSRLSLERISGVLGTSGLGGQTTALPPSSDPVAPVGTQGAWGQTNAPRSSRAALVTALGIGAVALGAAAFVLGRHSQEAPAVTGDAGPASPTTARAASSDTSVTPVPAPSVPAVPRAPESQPAAASAPSPAPVASSAAAPASDAEPAVAAPRRKQRPTAKGKPAAIPVQPTPPPVAVPAPPPLPAPAPVKAPSPSKPAVDAFDDRK